MADRLPHLICTLLLAVSLFASPAPAAEFTVVTNLVPPIKDMDNGRLSGITGDILAEVMKRSGHTLSPKVQIVPLSEALDITGTRPGTICLALARTPERTPHYKWVGPVYSVHTGIIAKRSRALNLPSLHAASKLTLASVKDSAPEKLLMGSRIPASQFRRFKTALEAVRALGNDEVDGLLMPIAPTYHLMHANHINPEQYESAIVFDTMKLYFAFNPDTETHVIHEIQQALDDLKKRNRAGHSEYLSIISKYYGAGF